MPSMSGRRARGALESLARQSTAHRTIVVDNGSPGAAVARACEDFPFAEAMRAEANLGFSRAVNQAARRALGAAIVLVNDDASYDRDFVERLVAALDPPAGVMMAAGVLRSASDPRAIDTAGIVIDRTLLAFDHLHGEALSVLDGEVPDPVGPSGVGAAYDRVAFQSLGGFDERIFAYFEDLDLALRMRNAGWTCRLVKDARGTHEHSATLGAGSAEKDFLMGFARGYLLRKWSVLSVRRVLGVGVREAVICAGQAVADRNLQGVRGRFTGWSRATPGEGFPTALVEREPTLTLGQSLARRALRRHRAPR